LIAKLQDLKLNLIIRKIDMARSKSTMPHLAFKFICPSLVCPQSEYDGFTQGYKHDAARVNPWVNA
tara:strand:+ start:1127 stop:1324 length:198 start_codon:yes stop_codon:yes gene_type:complete